jgi:hypothetical protein
LRIRSLRSSTERPCLVLMLKADDGVVRKADDGMHRRPDLQQPLPGRIATISLRREIADAE